MASSPGAVPGRIRKGLFLTTRPGIDRALARALRWVLGGGAISLPLIAVPGPERSQLLVYSIVHLAALVALGLFVAWDLARFLDDTWFGWLGSFGRRVASGAATVALTVGVVALVTLPASAALRLTPSLQFLQLLSALDIAWAAGATLIGVRWLAGRKAGAVAGAVVGVVCVWSIWNYLTIVGFAPDGGWQVNGAALLRYVLPYDMAAATIAVLALTAGARHVSHHVSHPAGAVADT